MSQGFRVLDADYERDLPRLRAVREPVFIIEQQVPPDLEWDELDPLSIHVLALDDQDAPIGTGRLTPEHKVGRMAVLAPWRSAGVGAAMLERLLAHARRLGYPEIVLHAQVRAIDFYSRHGFEAFGEEYDEAGIRHRSMRMTL